MFFFVFKNIKTPPFIPPQTSRHYRRPTTSQTGPPPFLEKVASRVGAVQVCQKNAVKVFKNPPRDPECPP